MSRYWALLLVAALPACADFSYQETTKITGGSLVKMMKWVPGAGKSLEPQTSHVYLKGNRMAHVWTERMSIIDIDKETMTEVNLEKKTFAVITFAEFRQAMEEMARKTAAIRADASKQAAAAPTMTLTIKETGQTRTISGLATKEFLMTIAMAAQSAQPGAPSAGMSEMETSLWMTPKVPGFDETQAFYKRMAEKMGWTPGMNPLVMQQQNSADFMKKWMDELSKMDGTPILTILKIKGSSPLGMPPGAAPSSASSGGSDAGDAVEKAAEQEAQRQAQYEASRQASKATGGRLGGFAGAAAGGIMGGMMKGKKKEAPPQEAPRKEEPKPAAPAGDPILMESTSESSNFSNASVDSAKFNVPTGFKEVEHDMKKALRELNKK